MDVEYFMVYYHVEVGADREPFLYLYLLETQWRSAAQMRVWEKVGRRSGKLPLGVIDVLLAEASVGLAPEWFTLPDGTAVRTVELLRKYNNRWVDEYRHLGYQRHDGVVPAGALAAEV